MKRGYSLLKVIKEKSHSTVVRKEFFGILFKFWRIIHYKLRINKLEYGIRGQKEGKNFRHVWQDQIFFERSLLLLCREWVGEHLGIVCNCLGGDDNMLNEMMPEGLWGIWTVWWERRVLDNLGRYDIEIRRRSKLRYCQHKDVELSC